MFPAPFEDSEHWDTEGNMWWATDGSTMRANWLWYNVTVRDTNGDGDTHLVLHAPRDVVESVCHEGRILAMRLDDQTICSDEVVSRMRHLGCKLDDGSEDVYNLDAY